MAKAPPYPNKMPNYKPGEKESKNKWWETKEAVEDAEASMTIREERGCGYSHSSAGKTKKYI